MEDNQKTQESPNTNQNQQADINETNLNINAEFGSSWSNLIRIGVMVFVTFVCCIAFFFVLLRFSAIKAFTGKLLKASQSILIGLLLAYILNPIMKGIDRSIYARIESKYEDKEKAKKLSRAIGIAGTTVIFLLAISTLIASVIPALIKSITHFSNAMPRYVNQVVDFIENGKFGDTQIKALVGDYIEEAADMLQSWFQNNVLSEAQTYITQITSGVIGVVKGILNFIIGIIVMDYVMAIQGTLSGQVKKIIYAIFKPNHGNMVVSIIRKTNSIFGGFITGKIIDSIIIGIIAYIGCSIMKIPDTVLVATIIGFTNVIPFFGPFIGAVPSLLLVVLQSPWHALYLLIFIIVLQQVDGNIIGPKILGSSTGLSSFWVMVAILVGGGLFGVAGMIFGVPVFALLYYILTNVVNLQLKKKDLSTDTKEYTTLKNVDLVTNQIVMKEPKKIRRKEKK